jgi:hypothetical protein
LGQTGEEGGELVICFIIDEKVSQTVSSVLTYIGFMGEKMGEDLRKTLLLEYEARAKAKLAEAESLARAKNVKLRTLLVEGDVVRETVKLSEKEGVELLLINPPPEKSDIYRTFFGDALTEIAKKVKCPIRVLSKKLLKGF